MMSDDFDPFLILKDRDLETDYGRPKFIDQDDSDVELKGTQVSHRNIISAETIVKSESGELTGEDKSKNLPKSIVFTFPDIWPGPPGFKGPTTVRIFDDGRTVSKGIAVARSRHARFYLGGYLFWQYNTTPHRVTELETCGVMALEMSHGNGWREFPFENAGHYRKAITHFDWLTRPDIDTWLYAHCRRTA